jgi:hypothetical protein
VSRPARAAALLALAWAGAARAGEPAAWMPDRRDYAAFREAWPEVLEPNYLPFMAHRLPGSAAEGDWLVFCRWEAGDMPLAVAIEAPGIPEALQNEFAPRRPEEYVGAVERALAIWEAELEGLVRFRRVAQRSQAALALVLVGAVAPEPDPDHRVLGLTPLSGSCRSEGLDPDAERLRVRFRVPELRIFVADGFGLLEVDQVQWIALHEIGHALGMRSHSPIPADLMYEVARERVHVAGLSTEDVNSFVSLYRLPNGTVFGHARAAAPGAAASPAPPSGAPMLAPGPFVDVARGYELRVPDGWLAMETSQGMVAVDGVTWDYTASFQIVVQRFPTIAAYLERYASYYRTRGRIRRGAPMVVNGRPALQVAIETFDDERAEEITLIELGDGRVMVVIADSPREAIDAWRPWFRAALGSLEIWPPLGSERGASSGSRAR